MGVDLDAGALAAAVRNGQSAPVRWARADAASLPVATGAVQPVLLNPPWGRVVEPSGPLARRPDLLAREVRRVPAPGGTAVVVVPEGHAAPAGFRVDRRLPVALSGSRLVVLVLG
jgi:tRNA (guanine6-N2)-methyltransferase